MLFLQVDYLNKINGKEIFLGKKKVGFLRGFWNGITRNRYKGKKKRKLKFTVFHIIFQHVQNIVV